MLFNITFKKLVFSTFVILVLQGIQGCNSSEYPQQSVTGPTTASGVIFETVLEYDAGNNPVALALGDFNSDTKTDIVITSSRSQSGYTTVADGTLTFYTKNTADSKFPFDKSTSVPSSGEWRQDVVAADFTGDNVTDLVVTSSDADLIKLLKNTSGSFSDNGTLTVGDVPLSMTTGDWNADNQTDLAVVNRDNGSVSVLTNSSGVFSVSATLTYDNTTTTSYYPTRVVSGDWDNDSNTDLAVLWKGLTIVQTFLNEGGTFTADKSITVGTAPRDLITGDWDCDGHLDLATSNYSDNTLSLLYGGSGSSFSAVTITAGKGPSALAYADFDNDSQMDFLVGHYYTISSDTTTISTGDVSLTLSDNVSKRTYGTPDKFTATLDNIGAPPSDIVITYADNDSKLDALMTVPVTKKLSVLSGKKYEGTLTCP